MNRFFGLIQCAMLIAGFWGAILTESCCADDEITPTKITDLPPEATEFLRAAAVLLLPSEFADDDDWNQHKKIQSGLNVDFKGGKLHTSRRYKDVRHGTWKRVDAKLVSPEQFFQLKVQLVPKTNDKPAMYRIQVMLRVDAQATQQRWQRGVQLYSATAAGVADVTLFADVEFSRRWQTIDGQRRLLLMPRLHAAKIQLNSFHLNRLGKLKGKTVSELSNIFEAGLRAAVKRKNQKLVSKINAKIEKKPRRFEVPAALAALLNLTHQQEASHDGS